MNVAKAIQSKIKVETEMCYLELEGQKDSRVWKNKRGFRDSLNKIIFDK